MIKLFIVSIFALTISSVQAKLVFSLKKTVEYDDFKTQSVFTLLDSGKFSFKTTTGGFHLCSDYPSGSFKGTLDKKDLKELTDYFKEMDKTCSKLDSCSIKKVQNEYDWSLLGWGDYSDKQYFLKSDSKRPRILTKVFQIQKKLYQNPEFSIKIDKIKKSSEKVNLKIKYSGKGEFEFSGNNSSFIVLGKKEQRRLGTKLQRNSVIHSGHSINFSIDIKSNNLNKGDYLIYSPPHRSEISACIVL
jgi:hypothetical protein